MKAIKTELPEVILIEPRAYADSRGLFMETFQALKYRDAGIAAPFVQDNVSYSHRGVLRGLHFQNPQSQGKLVYVLQGEIFDVAVDVRRGSPTFGRWLGTILSAECKRQLWVPEGFAHGFCVQSETALVVYKCTNYYDPKCESSIRWDDPDIGIRWPVQDPKLSIKDSQAELLKHIDADRLPEWGGPDRSA